jgi:hypothetical protein
MSRKYTKAFFAGTLLLLASSVSAAVDLKLFWQDSSLPRTPLVEPGAEATFVYWYAASNTVDARIIHPLPAGGRFLRWSDPRWSCVAGTDAVTCTRHIEFVENPSDRFLKLSFVASDDPEGLIWSGSPRIESDEPDPTPADNAVSVTLTVYRTFTVTTPDDFGAGSLRDAIERANGACNGALPCKIRFAEPMRIAPSSPLPRVTACDLLIDGGGGEGRRIDRGFDVPRRVEISGENAGPANGFTMASPCGDYRVSPALRGLAIHSFLGNGVLVEEPAQYVRIDRSSIGTDATGTVAHPNIRGISVDAPEAYLEVNDSLISGNSRSGIAIWRGKGGPLRGNLIGVRFGGIPLPNGASGIYTNDGWLALNGNAIEYNHDFGVAVGPGAKSLSSVGDYITLNGGIAIDWGLDGPTPNEGRGRMPPVPELLDAYYDRARNETVISGVMAAGSSPHNFYQIHIYAAAGDFEGGIHLPLWSGPGWVEAGTNVPFVVTVRGDQTGRTITAAAFRYTTLDFSPMDISEFSAGIVVR